MAKKPSTKQEKGNEPVTETAQPPITETTQAPPTSEVTNPDGKGEGEPPVNDGSLKSEPIEAPPTSEGAAEELKSEESSDKSEEEKENTKETQEDPSLPAVEDPSVTIGYDGAHFRLGERRYVDLTHVLNELPEGTLLKVKHY